MDQPSHEAPRGPIKIHTISQQGLLCLSSGSLVLNRLKNRSIWSLIRSLKALKIPLKIQFRYFWLKKIHFQA